MTFPVSQKRVIRCITILFALVILTAGTSAAQDYRTLSVTSLDGEEIALTELLKTGPVLVNFWALWCEPCKIELKHFQSLYDRYKERGFTILAVNQDNPRSTAKVSSYIASHGFSFPVAADPEGETAQQWNVQSIPLSLLFDTNGTVVYKALGYKPGDEQKIEEALQRLLATHEQK